MRSEVTEFLMELEDVTMNGTEHEYFDLVRSVSLDKAVALHAFGATISQLFEAVVMERLTEHPEQFEGLLEDSD